MLITAMKSLTPDERKTLQAAFEDERSELIFKGEFFIGVNCESIPNLVILEQRGCWFYGRRVS